jgi:hypothetical protein
MGAVQSLCSLLLSVSAFAICVPKRVTQSSVRRLALVLISIVGVSAFVLSAISTDDDLLQHEFLRSGPLFRTSAKNTGRATAPGSSVKFPAIAAVVAPPHLGQPNDIVGRSFFNTLIRPGRLGAYTSAGRSPPIAI